MSIAADGAPSLKKVIDEVWAQSRGVFATGRLKGHRVLERIPGARQAEAKALLTAVRAAPDYESGFPGAKELVKKDEKVFPPGNEPPRRGF